MNKKELKEKRKSELYAFLLEKSSTTNDFITKEEIAKALPTFYPREKEKSTRGNSTAYRTMTKDIQELKKDVDKKTIISTTGGNGGFKIGDEKESNKKLDKDFICILGRIKLNSTQKYKAGNNNQATIKNGDMEVINAFKEQ